MFVRFITVFKNMYCERETGIFQALGYLRRHIDTVGEDVEKLLLLRDWFDLNLNPPTRFTKRRSSKDSGTAVSWYRDTSKEHIAKTYELKVILEKYGIIVDTIHRKDPGYIVYEDEFQVAAIPYREDREKVI